MTVHHPLIKTVTAMVAGLVLGLFVGFAATVCAVDCPAVADVDHARLVELRTARTNQLAALFALTNSVLALTVILLNRPAANGQGSTSAASLAAPATDQTRRNV